MGLVSSSTLALPGWPEASPARSVTSSDWASLVQHPHGHRRFAVNDLAPASLAGYPPWVPGLFTHSGPPSYPRAVMDGGCWDAGTGRAAPK